MSNANYQKAKILSKTMIISKNIGKKELILVAIAVAIYLVITLIAHRTTGDFWLIIVLAVILTMILGLQLVSLKNILWNFNRSIIEQSNTMHRYIEALFNIFSLLKPRFPLPPLDGWAMSPHSIVELISQIHYTKPSLILELGSGVSTLVSSYCLEQLGSGRILSLDHDENFGNVTRENLKKHGLSDIAKIIYSPLKPVHCGDREFIWYDLNDKKLRAELNNQINMLIIDGPPDDLQSLSRYPAIPLLFDHLSEGAIIILDDYDRVNEKTVVDLWQQEFGLKIKAIAVEEQAVVLQKIS